MTMTTNTNPVSKQTVRLTHAQAIALAERHAARGNRDKAQRVYAEIARQMAEQADVNDPTARLAVLAACILGMGR